MVEKVPPPPPVKLNVFLVTNNLSQNGELKKGRGTVFFFKSSFALYLKSNLLVESWWSNEQRQSRHFKLKNFILLEMVFTFFSLKNFQYKWSFSTSTALQIIWGVVGVLCVHLNLRYTSGSTLSYAILSGQF